MAGVVEALGAIFGGGVTGLVGSAITAFTEVKREGMRFKHNEAMAQLALDTTKAEAEGKFKVIDREVEGRVAVGELQALQASYAADKATYSTSDTPSWVRALLGLVDVLRGSVRPVITYYFTVFISIAFFKFYTSAISTVAVEDILGRIVTVVLYVGTTCILWWFGTRNKIFNNT